MWIGRHTWIIWKSNIQEILANFTKFVHAKISMLPLYLKRKYIFMIHFKWNTSLFKVDFLRLANSDIKITIYPLVFFIKRECLQRRKVIVSQFYLEKWCFIYAFLVGVTVDALFFGNIFKFSWPPFFIEGLYVGSMNWAIIFYLNLFSRFAGQKTKIL